MEIRQSPFAPNFGNQGQVSLPSFEEFCSRSGVTPSLRPQSYPIPQPDAYFWAERKTLLETQTPGSQGINNLVGRIGPFLSNSATEVTEVDSDSEEAEETDFQPQRSLQQSNASPTVQPSTTINSKRFEKLAILQAHPVHVKFFTFGNQFIISSDKKGDNTFHSRRPLDNLLAKANLTGLDRKALHIAGNDNCIAVAFSGTKDTQGKTIQEKYITVYVNGEDFFLDVNRKKILLNGSHSPEEKTYSTEDISSMCFLGKDLVIGIKNGPILTYDFESNTWINTKTQPVAKLYSSESNDSPISCFVSTYSKGAIVNIWEKDQDNQYRKQSIKVSVNGCIEAVGFDTQFLYFGGRNGKIAWYNKNQSIEALVQNTKLTPSPIIGFAVFPHGIVVASKKEVMFLNKHRSGEELNFTHAYSLPVEIGPRSSISAIKKIGENRVVIGTSSGQVHVFDLKI